MERIWIFYEDYRGYYLRGSQRSSGRPFEGQYRVPNGMAYNSYVILDEKTAVMDTVDANFADEWLANVAKALDGRKPDYLIVQHMEPDHSANIENFVKSISGSNRCCKHKNLCHDEKLFPQDGSRRKETGSKGWRVPYA